LLHRGGTHIFTQRREVKHFETSKRGGGTYFYVVKGDCAVNVVEDDVREKSIIASKLFEEAKVLRDLEGIFDRFLFEPFANKKCTSTLLRSKIGTKMCLTSTELHHGRFTVRTTDLASSGHFWCCIS